MATGNPFKGKRRTRLASRQLMAALLFIGLEDYKTPRVFYDGIRTGRCQPFLKFFFASEESSCD